ncbi:hypothetical protein Tco_0975935 [Tanacetum coccineum]|uniref:Uncharacterized protein n=1 Tax=Tanacetum coccineum TaxID=301880 RepID=A0ABQ5EG44_9ASTR
MTLDPPILSTALCVKVVQELDELQAILAYINSRLKNIEKFLNGFVNPPNEIDMDDLERDDESVDTPFVSPFLDSDNDSDDGEVLNEIEEYRNAWKLCRKRKFVSYFDPFLPMNIITHKAYNTIMVEGLKSKGRNLVAIVRDVYLFVGSFTYVTDFVVLEDIEEFIISDIIEVVMAKPFRNVTQIEYDCVKGLVSFTRILDNYTFQMPRTIPMFKNGGYASWSKIPPIHVLSKMDLMNGFKYPHEKNKLMYKNCLNLGSEYQVDESMKEWLIHGHVSLHEVTSRKMSQPANDDYSQHLSDNEASYHEDASNSDMEMEHYLEYIDNDVWKVIQNGNSKKRISTGKDGVVRILPSVSAAEIHAVKKERKARTILLMAIPKEHLRRFHGMDDAKEIWEAIRTRFGGNANSKKMQKAVLKQQFEAFSISSSDGLEKGYDRFQQLLSQLEAHGAEVSTEDANHKFLRSLPPAWSNLAMTMRTKPDVDTLSIDDLYNNLRVFEQELTSTSKSSASAQNVAFVSHNKSSTNKVKSGHTGAYSTYTPTSSNNIQEREVPAGFADEVIYSLFAKQSEDLDLLHEDLEQIDDVDIEEMDINWQIAMIAIRMKKFYKKTGSKKYFGSHLCQGDDVADFAIALRMFTRSLIIQKPDLRKRHPYNPYKDPQGFIYVNDYKRNMLMRSDKLYKFSDGTLTMLLSLLEDISKNIDMEYLPKRRWSTLEKKRAHFMIKDINKLLKERRM